MSIINLDPNFTPYGEGLQINSFNFPSGCEPHIKVQEYFRDERVCITCRIQSSDDIMRLLLTVDAVKRSRVKNIELFLPYLPFARQDRVMVKGEPLSVKVMADLINAQGFSKVSIYDPHSEVCMALINNCVAIPNYSFVDKILHDKRAYYIVSPDAGALKKVYNVCQKIGHKNDVVVCNKRRDVSTGKLSNITIDTLDFQGFDLYIIDDICDGGGTFAMLASEIRKRNNVGKINLIVSHGIFSKGIDALEGVDHIYTTNSFKDHTHEKLTQIKLTYGLLS